MLLNPSTKVEIGMLMPVMIDFCKIMVDRQGSPEGHHDK